VPELAGGSGGGTGLLVDHFPLAACLVEPGDAHDVGGGGDEVGDFGGEGDGLAELDAVGLEFQDHGVGVGLGDGDWRVGGQGAGGEIQGVTAHCDGAAVGGGHEDGYGREFLRLKALAVRPWPYCSVAGSRMGRPLNWLVGLDIWS
jgi:hypothetical protein